VGHFGDRDYIRRDGRFLNGLEIHVTSFIDLVLIQVGTITVTSVTGPVQKVTSATSTAIYLEDVYSLIKPPVVSGLHSRSLGNPSTSVKMCRMKGFVEELILDLILEDDCFLDYCSISEKEEVIGGKNDWVSDGRARPVYLIILHILSNRCSWWKEDVV